MTDQSYPTVIHEPVDPGGQQPGPDRETALISTTPPPKDPQR